MEPNGVELRQLDDAGNRVEDWLARGARDAEDRHTDKPEVATTVEDISTTHDSPAEDASSAANPTAAQDTDVQSTGGQRPYPLSTRSRRVLLIALSLALFVSIFGVGSIAPAIPVIAYDLNTGISTSWIGTSCLAAATAFQLVNNRLSDLIGYKNCLPLFLILMSTGDIGCGFSFNQVSLFGFRVISGIGQGGVISMIMIITADLANPQPRGRWQRELQLPCSWSALC